MRKKKRTPADHAASETIKKARELYQATGKTYGEVLNAFLLKAGGPYKLAKKAGIPLATMYVALETRSLEKLKNLCERIAESEWNTTGRK